MGAMLARRDWLSGSAVAGAAGVASAALLAVGAWRLRKLRLPPGRPLPSGQMLIGHRGCRGSGSPAENTLEAFEYALDRGAHGFELDTRLTRDGCAVVFHDCSIGRCLAPGIAGNVKVSDLTRQELQQLNFKDAPEARVPTLEEAVLLAKRRKAHILIETKDIHQPEELAARVVELIRKHDMVELAVVISFDPRSLYYIRKADLEVRTCFLWAPGVVSGWAITRTEEVLPLTWQIFAPIMDAVLRVAAHPALLPSLLGVSAIGPRVKNRRTYLDAAYRRGMSTYLWVVNDAETRADVALLADRGLYAYSTDWLWSN